jgi:hypothetical protein
MKARQYIALVSTFAIGMHAAAVEAQSQQAPANDDKVATALAAIADFADRMCSDPALASKSGFDVRGKIEAELKGLTKKLADVGLDGTVDIAQMQERVAVLQKDLAGALKNRDECRYRYMQELKPIYFPGGR